MSPENVPALEMVNVTVGSLWNPNAVALEEVSWSVSEGDYWVVAGLQSTGKTDLISTAAGLLPPVSGTYRIFGHELKPGYEQQLLEVRLAVALVFDGGRLFNDLSIAENIALPLRYHQNLSFADCAPRVNALLELVGLAGRPNAMPGVLPRSLRQRVGLARALATLPKVLLLDNPLTGLDPRDALWWVQLLDQLAAGHKILDNAPLTLVITGDDLRPWRQHARQFAVLNQNRFIPLGDREKLDQHSEASLMELLRTK